MYYLYICIENFSSALEKEHLKKDGETGKQTKSNGSTEYEIEKVKQTR